MGKITVVDAPCGAGKTTWAIQEMARHPERAYIYCTPFLDEIDRVIEECDRRIAPGWMQSPQSAYNFTKLEDFNRLLARGDNVAVTHTTFLNATPETLQALHEGEYTLILDEALDVVQEFNAAQTVAKSPRQTVTKEDIRSVLLGKGMVSIAEDGKVTWLDGEAHTRDFKFYEVQRFAELGRLYCVDRAMLMVVYPAEIFEALAQTYVLTYMFGGSILKPYCEAFDLSYKLASIVDEDGERYLGPYSPTKDVVFRQLCQTLVDVCDDRYLNSRRWGLSKSWYNAATTKDKQAVKSCVRRYFRRYVPSARASDLAIMWTCPAEFEGALQGQGYTTARQLTAAERKLPKEDQEKIRKQLRCFVPCNAKATNIYRSRWAMAYLYNVYVNPMFMKFFAKFGVQVDEDAYALSALVQWMCRSRLRDGQPVCIYVPSKRMRELLAYWIDGA
jgi:hypothetical protein